MVPFTQRSFAASGVRSLCWRGDDLVDWVGGGRVFALDGTERRASVSYSYRFDAATASTDGHFVVIYERLGTKALLLRDGQILRQLDRDFYHANAYEYPVALFNGPDGRLLLAHCPGSYCGLALEEAETGLSLTASADRKPSDFFHSRLAASPTGKRLLSAGWVWQPWGVVACFDVAQALADPRHLDRGDAVSSSSRNVGLAEENAACWLDDDRVAVAASAEAEDAEESSDAGDAPRLLPRGIAVYDLARGQCLRAVQLDDPPGTLLAVGDNHVLSLYRHPRLIDLATGEVLHAWPDLPSGRQDGSILWHLDREAMPPPMAFDAAGSRFAIAAPDRITIIDFDRAALARFG